MENYVKNISQLHTAIINGFENSLNANLDENKKIYIAAYPNIERSIKIPAVIIELSALLHAQDNGNYTKN